MRYLALDFDGTMLNSQGVMSDNLVNKLIELQKGDTRLIFATGRSIDGVYEFIDLVKVEGCKLYILCYNGAFLYEFDNELVCLKKQYMTVEQVRKIDELLCGVCSTFVTYSDGYINCNHVNDYVITGASCMNLKIGYDYIVPTPKIMIYEPVSNFQRVYSLLNKVKKDYKVEVFSSASHAIEITGMDVSKGLGLVDFEKYIDITADNVLCIGDNDNDLSFLDYTSNVVAMKNGSERFKKGAMIISTFSNDDDGVFRYLEEFYNV